MDNMAEVMRDMGKNYGQQRRDKARSTAMKRKEDYLGARVSKELRAKVIERADELEIPVSILIRNILEEAFTDKLEDNENTPLKENESRLSVKADEYLNVIAWKQITLNRLMPCTGCGTHIAAGSVATLGFTNSGEGHVVLCHNCKVSV